MCTIKNDKLKSFLLKELNKKDKGFQLMRISTFTLQLFGEYMKTGKERVSLNYYIDNLRTNNLFLCKYLHFLFYLCKMISNNVNVYVRKGFL